MALSSSELRELADLNLAESLREHALWSESGIIDERHGTLRVVSNTRFAAGMFNTVIRTSDQAVDAATWLDEQRRFFVERGRGFSVYTRGERDRPLATACTAAGFEIGDEHPGMACERALPESSCDRRVRIELATDPLALARVIDIEASAYAPMGLPESVLRKVMSAPTRLLRPSMLWLLASWEGEPAAAALVVMSHTPLRSSAKSRASAAGLYWVATAPAFRGRGLGQACTRAATNAAFERGARAVVLQASRMGEPIYRKLGFREVTRYRWFWTERARSAALTGR
jgi:ribosomal protein S18 acetylase RimI-like enzyme